MQHQNFFELITDNQVSIEEDFNPIRFETGIGEKLPQGGFGKPPRYALLDEQQVTYLISLSRNTPVVKRFKRGLVKAFFDVRQKLAERPMFRIPQTYLEAMELATTALRDKKTQKGLTRALCKAVERQTAIIHEVTAKLEEAKPGNERWHDFLGHTEGFTVAEASRFIEEKLGIQIGEIRFWQLLRDLGWVMKSPSYAPYQIYSDREYIREFTNWITRPKHGEMVNQRVVTTRVLTKGMNKLIVLFANPTEKQKALIAGLEMSV